MVRLKSIREIIADKWGVGKEIIMDLPKLTIAGNKEIYIESYKGVARYEPEEIWISSAIGTLIIKGAELKIEYIGLESLLISGTFSEIKYNI